MTGATKKAKVQALRSFLEDLRHVLPKVFQLPLGAKYKCSDIIVDECRIMSSKQAPLWLVFEPAKEQETMPSELAANMPLLAKEHQQQERAERGGKGRRPKPSSSPTSSKSSPETGADAPSSAQKNRKIKVLFKVGDDLRQDQVRRRGEKR